LYFISVFIIICGRPTLTPIPIPSGCSRPHSVVVVSAAPFFYYRSSLGLLSLAFCEGGRGGAQEQRRRRWQLPAIVLISVSLS